MWRRGRLRGDVDVGEGEFEREGLDVGDNVGEGEFEREDKVEGGGINRLGHDHGSEIYTNSTEPTNHITSDAGSSNYCQVEMYVFVRAGRIHIFKGGSECEAYPPDGDKDGYYKEATARIRSAKGTPEYHICIYVIPGANGCSGNYLSLIVATIEQACHRAFALALRWWTKTHQHANAVVLAFGHDAIGAWNTGGLITSDRPSSECMILSIPDGDIYIPDDLTEQDAKDIYDYAVSLLYNIVQEEFGGSDLQVTIESVGNFVDVYQFVTKQDITDVRNFIKQRLNAIVNHCRFDYTGNWVVLKENVKLNGNDSLDVCGASIVDRRLTLLGNTVKILMHTRDDTEPTELDPFIFKDGADYFKLSLVGNVRLGSEPIELAQRVFNKNSSIWRKIIETMNDAAIRTYGYKWNSYPSRKVTIEKTAQNIVNINVQQTNSREGFTLKICKPDSGVIGDPIECCGTYGKVPHGTLRGWYIGSKDTAEPLYNTFANICKARPSTWEYCKKRGWVPNELQERLEEHYVPDSPEYQLCFRVDDDTYIYTQYEKNSNFGDMMKQHKANITTQNQNKRMGNIQCIACGAHWDQTCDRGQYSIHLHITTKYDVNCGSQQECAKIGRNIQNALEYATIFDIDRSYWDLPLNLMEGREGEPGTLPVYLGNDVYDNLVYNNTGWYCLQGCYNVKFESTGYETPASRGKKPQFMKPKVLSAAPSEFNVSGKHCVKQLQQSISSPILQPMNCIDDACNKSNEFITPTQVINTANDVDPNVLSYWDTIRPNIIADAKTNIEVKTAIRQGDVVVMDTWANNALKNTNNVKPWNNIVAWVVGNGKQNPPKDIHINNNKYTRVHNDMVIREVVYKWNTTTSVHWISFKLHNQSEQAQVPGFTFGQMPPHSNSVPPSIDVHSMNKPGMKLVSYVSAPQQHVSVNDTRPKQWSCSRSISTLTGNYGNVIIYYDVYKGYEIVLDALLSAINEKLTDVGSLCINKPWRAIDDYYGGIDKEEYPEQLPIPVLSGYINADITPGQMQDGKLPNYVYINTPHVHTIVFTRAVNPTCPPALEDELYCKHYHELSMSKPNRLYEHGPTIHKTGVDGTLTYAFEICVCWYDAPVRVADFYKTKVRAYITITIKNDIDINPIFKDIRDALTDGAHKLLRCPMAQFTLVGRDCAIRFDIPSSTRKPIQKNGTGVITHRQHGNIGDVFIHPILPLSA